jgi:hypothetical protein
MTALTIPKEQITSHRFAPSPRQHTPDNIYQVQSDLFRAMIIGNSSQGKVKIEFETQNGPHSVETTVWAATDRYVSLKGGVNIPVGSINEVFVY